MFTAFEINLITIFFSSPREGIISNLEDMLMCLNDTETEMYSAIQSTLTKLKEMTDEAFYELDLTIENRHEAEVLVGMLKELLADAQETLEALLEES